MEIEEDGGKITPLVDISTPLEDFDKNRWKKILIGVFIVLLAVFTYFVLSQNKKTTNSEYINKTIIITPAITKSVSQQTNTIKRETIGFLPSWSVAKKTKVYSKDLTQIIYFGLNVNKDGSIVKYDENNLPVLEWSYFNSDYFKEIKREASISGTKILLSIKSFDNTTIDNIISSQIATSKLTGGLLTLIKQYSLDGINIDFEYFTDTNFPTSKYLAAFLEELSANLKKDNPNIIVSIDVNATVVVKDRAYNMTKISRVVDQVILMAYDYRGQNSTRAGPAAPIYGEANEHSIWESVESLSGRVPNNKLILAIPFYGYEWQTFTDRHKSSVIEGSGALATYKRVKELLKERSDIIKSWDDISKSPWLSYIQYGAIKQIYYEDDRSIAEKIKFAKEKNMGGIAIWALGYEGNYRQPWEVIETLLD
ncbi:MAG: hypothetical protein A3B44_01680 [Candidatus Levybacteria bacterium RIFCSPLOWO2_01_FULL_38_21]|nr:MAG: hypothetical protein A3B44_01680 [Candidatus Levybacteria bacterium RIFCSPLOWO2_01_FULL_38_21]